MTKICRHFALGETGRYDKVQERDQTQKAPSVCLAVFSPIAQIMMDRAWAQKLLIISKSSRLVAAAPHLDLSSLIVRVLATATIGRNFVDRRLAHG